MKRLSGHNKVVGQIVFLSVIVLQGSRARADFTFGEPLNLGPNVNSPFGDQGPSISADGLELYFMSNRPGGYGRWDIWVARRETTNDEWTTPINLGPTINSASREGQPQISADGLSLFFDSDRPGGYGTHDIWISHRPSKMDPWEEPVNLGPIVNTDDAEWDASPSMDGLEMVFCRAWRDDSTSPWIADLYMTFRMTQEDPWAESIFLAVNSSAIDANPRILPDGLTLLYASDRTDGYGERDLWMAARQTKTAEWSEPVNLGPIINSSFNEDSPDVSSDGQTLYFYSDSLEGMGDKDIWQASIIPFVDFNGNGIVDIKDLEKLIESWGQKDPSMDIGPMPWGDGVVDNTDLEVLMSHWNQEVNDPTLIACWKLDETEGDVAYDSASTNDAILLGDALWWPEGGYVDGALSLDGTDDCLNTPLELNPADTVFSVFAWVKGGVPGQVIASQNEGTNWLMADATSGCLETGLQSTSRREGRTLTSEVVITDGQWHRIGLTWDGSTRALYLDDVIVAQDNQPDLKAAEGNLHIGAGSQLENGSFWSGLIDDVRIYDRVVTP